MSSMISGSVREKWLRFFWLKTAAVREGVKPGELLRVRHRYEERDSSPMSDSLSCTEIFEILRLDHHILYSNFSSSLVLFFRRESLENTLSAPEARAFLSRCGYPEGAAAQDALASLRKRCAGDNIPHEVGIFIGYPPKDVAGFIERQPRTPIRNGNWQVFGDASESLSRMNLYRQAERIASDLLDACGGLQTFFNQTTFRGTPENRSIANG